ncbi:MAG TPA: hypothetical protein VHS59_10120 [Bacillota bacterium]|nr:hypothetical protein [Bacillota bacterium]
MRILHQIRKLSLKILGLAAGLVLIQLLVFPTTINVVIFLLLAMVLAAFLCKC